MTHEPNKLKHLDLGSKVEYLNSWQAMQHFTKHRDNNTQDEIWTLQHSPVFTFGRQAKPEHLLKSSDIPIIHSDRGGQVTYHGPGQAVFYLLLDLKRRKLGIRALVSALEQAVINFLAQYGVQANNDPKAPGVYVNGSKVAALGLKISRHYCYHGLSLNVDMDLTPFTWINPCGYRGLKVTQCKDLGISQGIHDITFAMIEHINHALARTEQL